MRRRRSEPIATEGWEYDTRVRVNMPGHMLHNMLGTVVDIETDTLQVRFDVVTEPMKGYGDTKKGLANIEPKYLERV